MRTLLAILLFIAAVGGLLFWERSAQAPTYPVELNTANTAATGTEQTTSDGTVVFTTPQDFGLAVTQEQVPVHSYIPPCEQNFNYCLYYNGVAYQGTNFESAGFSIVRRADLGSERLCLDTPPEGFGASVTPASTTSADEYSTSVFPNVGDAAAGHYSSGALWRLWVRGNSHCYEFLARIGETQFANYPAGSIKKFTDDDRATLGRELEGILNSITLASGTAVTFPNTR